MLDYPLARVRRAVEGMESVIPNRLEDIYELEARILEQVERAGYDENARFAIRLALDEALINAYKHGNGEDPRRNIRVRFVVRDEEVEFEVEDEGPGFEVHTLDDPRMGDGLHRTSGRGIFLIRQFMSSILFNERGNRITFTYERRPDLGVNEHGLSHWKFDAAEVIELDPVRIDRCPNIILESVVSLLDNGASQIVLDLRFIDQIDSKTLELLRAAHEEVARREARLLLIRPQPEVERAIQEAEAEGDLRLFANLKLALDHIARAD